MAENDGDNKASFLNESELKNELSALVEKKLISSKIADKIGNKLNEKQIKISKEQLQKLVQKISEIIRSGQIPERVKKVNNITKDENEVAANQTFNTDMKRLVDTIEKLENRLNKIENVGILQEQKAPVSIPTEEDNQNISQEENKNGTPTTVTTENIKITEKINVPITEEWSLDPLKEIPSDPENIIILMKWLQYLIDKCGRQHLSNILDYYVDIGWISEDAKISLIDYSHGITEERNQDSNMDQEIHDLPSKDHIQSLLFIQRLKGKQIDKHFLERINGELTRITKKINHYNMK